MSEDSIAKLANAIVQAKVEDSVNAKKKSLDISKIGRDSSLITIKQPTMLQLKAQSLFVSPFVWSPDKPQSIALVMTRVDPVYVTESKNAFDRYNRENFYGKNYATDKISLS